MNDAIALRGEALPTPYELNSLSTQELRVKLAQSLTLSAQHLAYLAAVWGELEKRGEDLSDLRTGMAVYLPQIAAGRLDAEAVIRFAGQPTVLRSIAGLPLERQRSLAKGEPVRVLTVNAEGEYQDTALPAYTLTASQARMVFDGEKMRSLDEQRALLESARLSAKRRPAPGASNRVRYDAKADVVRIGRAAATVGEVSAALAEAARQREPERIKAILGAEEELAPIVVQLSKAERAQLKVRAAEADMTQQDYMRAMLVWTALL